MASKDKLPVLDVFGPTIQGEGYLCGQPTWFVRFAGCDYSCIKCDTMYAVDPKQFKDHIKLRTSEELVRSLLAKMGKCEWVTFSGGNPALNALDDVVDLLHAAGKYVAIETQGSKYHSWIARCDVITVSPKGPGMIVDTAIVMSDLEEFIIRLEHDLRQGPVGADGQPPIVSFKFPIFSSCDMDFAQSVVRRWPQFPAWLSIGNFSVSGEYPQEVQRQHILEDLERTFCMMQSGNYPELANCRILPQLHVLIWGNAPSK